MLDVGEDKNGNGKLDVDTPRRVTRTAIDKVDTRDGYTKVRGQIILADAPPTWQAGSTPRPRQDDQRLHDPADDCPAEPGQQPVKFGAPRQRRAST